MPSYTVQAQSVEDVQNAVWFARERNLRLVIRNTGHDLGGRSSGPGALQLDVSGLNSIKRDASFEPRGSPRDSGFLGISAVTVGGGARMGEVYELGAVEGFTVVGGGSSSVGIAGGFVQTGGMSMFSPSRGLASDNVLEIELVAANVNKSLSSSPLTPSKLTLTREQGSVIVANEYQNSDLFWACRGGGGGTFGVVTRMTLRTFPDTSGRVVRLVYDGLAQDPQIWPLVEEGLDVARNLNKAGHAARLITMPVGFTGNASLTFEAVLLGNAANDSQHELEQLKSSLEERGMVVQLHTETWSSIAKYLAEGLGPDPAGVAMLPVSALVSTELMDTSDGAARVSKALSGLPFRRGDAVSIDVWCGGRVNSNRAQSAVSPALRSSLMSLTVARGIPPNEDRAALAAIRMQIESVDFPRLLALEPGRTGVSPAFAYPYDNRFADHFWGPYYPQLREIKQRWDPDYVFITRLGVGSEDWDDEGLCRRQKSPKENLYFVGNLLETHGSVAIRQLRTLLEATLNVFLS